MSDDIITAVGTKGDQEHKRILQKILDIGSKDRTPRPRYKDGVPAHTLSYNGELSTYDISKGEFPIITLRPIATKSAIGEILWIYQDESSDLNLLKEKYDINWWDNWDLGYRSIGQCYGATVKSHNLMEGLLADIDRDPDGRRHIMDLWQVEDFIYPHGLKPCCFLTMWNVRHGENKENFLDMSLVIRSSDYATAGVINQVQYCVLHHLVARHCGYKVGIFNVFIQNVQIYDRHIDAVKELISRTPIDCKPTVWLNPNKKNFYDFTIDDIKILNYPIVDIKAKNPQITTFRDEIAI